MSIKQLEIEDDQLSKDAFELQNRNLVEERLIWQHLSRKKIHQMQPAPKSNSSELEQE